MTGKGGFFCFFPGTCLLFVQTVAQVFRLFLFCSFDNGCIDTVSFVRGYLGIDTDQKEGDGGLGRSIAMCFLPYHVVFRLSACL